MVAASCQSYVVIRSIICHVDAMYPEVALSNFSVTLLSAYFIFNASEMERCIVLWKVFGWKDREVLVQISSNVFSIIVYCGNRK